MTTTNPMERAKKVIPGGVSSPVRAFKGVGGDPVFIRAADGATLIDLDGKRYVDFICGYGPHILGHRHPAIVEAVQGALARGTTFGAPTLEEVELVEAILAAMPNLEMVRLVNSGTEATMSALRLARAATGRDKFLKFEGCYHGHADPYLVAAGSGAKTLGTPSSPGVPETVVADTLLAPYNDLEAVEARFREHADIAAVIVEPIAGNMGMVLPRPGFLEGLRRLCTEAGALLIYDEVMTGFRVAHGGAQELYPEVKPDLTTLGKVIGGGLPIAAYGGRRELMQQISPAGPVYQAGTLSGNPIAVAAGLAALNTLAADGGAAYRQLEETGTRLVDGLREVAVRRSIPLTLERRGGMLGFFFSAGPIHTQTDVDAADHERFKRVFHRLLDAGVHLAPSPYEALFFSLAHGETEITHTLEAFDEALAQE